MGRDHGVAGSIEQDSLQRSVVLGPRCDVMGSLLGQSPLHGLKQLAVDQWWLRARADLTLIENLADVEAIAQQVEQGALREGHAPSGLRKNVSPTTMRARPRNKKIARMQRPVNASWSSSSG